MKIRLFLEQIAHRIKSYFTANLERLNPPDPIMIQAYRGYANSEKLYLKGRVLEEEGISDGNHRSKRRNALDSLRRFETDEIPHVCIEVKINNQVYSTQTDHEGYFLIDQKWQIPVDFSKRWWPVKLWLPEVAEDDGTVITGVGSLFFPSPEAEYGVITDVDDTVLQTHVTSTLRLKMLYTTFLQNANQRLPMEGIVELFKKLEKGSDGMRENPFFYVSSSPWNLYDLLEQFLTKCELPKGPILLRDYGIDPSGPFRRHKLATISRILETYPNLPFIMLGDTASKDGDYYLQLAKRFPGRIKAIYIRQTRNNRNARRMKKLIESQTEVEAIVVTRSAEMQAHAREHGLIVS